MAEGIFYTLYLNRSRNRCALCSQARRLGKRALRNDLARKSGVLNALAEGIIGRVPRGKPLEEVGSGHREGYKKNATRLKAFPIDLYVQGVIDISCQWLWIIMMRGDYHYL